MNRIRDGYPKEVLGALNEQRKRAELTDVVLEVGGRSFPCHRAVLASCSPYFRTMFTSGYAETKQERISIQDVSEVAMATILDYAYTGCLQTEPGQVQAVMSAARLLQVDFVYRRATEYLKDKIDVSNCADVFMYADMLGDSDILKTSERYMASRFHQVVLQPSFVQLPLPLLQSLLHRDDLLANSEDDVVQAALRWVDFDQEERLQHLPVLCRCFRHSLISSDILVELESKCLSTDCKLVYSDSTTQRLEQTRTKMQIFLRENANNVHFIYYTPCYDPSTGMSYSMNLPKPRDGFSMAVTPDDELYLAGGDVRDNHDFLQYNHLLNSWEPRCNRIKPFSRCILVYLNGYIYSIGRNSRHCTTEKYDPSCDEWTSMAPSPKSFISSLFSDPFAVTLGDSIFVMHKDGCYSFSTTENTWNKIADMDQPPKKPHAVEYKGFIYCMDRSDLHYVEKYNPKNDTWERSGYMPHEYDDAILLLYSGSLYVLAIHMYTNRHTPYTSPYRSVPKKYDLFQYEEETNSWQQPETTGMITTPITQWLGSDDCTNSVCLTAKMIPKCLMWPRSNNDLEIPSSSSEEEYDDTDPEDW